MIARPTARKTFFLDLPANTALTVIDAYPITIVPYGAGTIIQTSLTFIGYDPLDFAALYAQATLDQSYFLAADGIMVSTLPALYGNDTVGINPAQAAVFPGVSGNPPVPNIVQLGVTNPNVAIAQRIKIQFEISITPGSFAKDLAV
jgi:hypothetical protein